MWPVAHRLQGLAPESPGGLARGRRLRPGPGSPRRGAPVPNVAQSVTRICRPEADQLQASDVAGRSLITSVQGFNMGINVLFEPWAVFICLFIFSSCRALILGEYHQKKMYCRIIVCRKCLLNFQYDSINMEFQPYSNQQSVTHRLSQLAWFVSLLLRCPFFSQLDV